ncbi:putative GTP-binding protein EngB [Mycoplasmopsis agalactiae]|uniref:Probable GTP-binding protein EngB n=1 Tax=Mycoplasmopsis agalactiae (strain NCTC 10123 / CIP 59.7 / PG2) TaxID=347257 RepID=ENGB_MYCAP|nr:ribosome biogenesis GTP-binding protein YihA/YsxC [Mycoplasmopsis agalactiae]A5IXT1.1 RecName: Full=Probable GTP-binding protein EngB [Mycoplasmopsis agalactiae PG2]MCE6056939.1 YihA family ribosome biogenesis GTP-binding protein [Mycoplasmopsis agalactiae]MCE6078725.1 YihA family ribosome biogenesis GTP-binding protein [Mycoplasmopsis agalactiae]MCE6095112.1 YihA family ribosome biogenesis GTP-binding protein [Mycoplasmopsis agalactiae]MCE6114362.1 YihA family ribosome biogenesis GTP-bindi
MWKFVKSALKKETWVKCEDCIQICFWGRSNVGKSSLLNALVNQKISYVSKQPGRTQFINYFQEENRFIVDLPGYGYAQLSKEKIEEMNYWISAFLKDDKCTKVMFLLIDSRTGITKIDLEKLAFLKAINLPIHLIYTKIDKLNQKEKSALVKKHNEYLDSNLLNESTNSFLVSSTNKIGLDDLVLFIEENIFKK